MLKYRTVSGLALGGAFLAAIHFAPRAMALPVLVSICCLAQFEFYSMLREAGIPAFRLVGTVCGALLIATTFWESGAGSPQGLHGISWERIVLAGTLLVIFVRQFPQKHNEKPLETIGCTLLGVWYVPYLFNFITRLLSVSDVPAPLPTATGRLLVLYLIVVVKCGDIGAYFVGRFLGRHRLFPRLSPKKTWEGLVGGIVLSVTASLGFQLFGDASLGVVPLRVGDALVLGVLLSAVGVVGDLFESLLKRASGIKDSGRALPGLGGVLDVLDSLLFGAPILYFYVKVLLVS